MPALFKRECPDCGQVWDNAAMDEQAKRVLDRNACTNCGGNLSRGRWVFQEKLPEKPKAILFYTEGVRCVVEDSPLVLTLKLREGMGVRLVSCRTCLEHYGLTGRVAAGDTGGMDEIVRLMDEARKVVTV